MDESNMHQSATDFEETTSSAGMSSLFSWKRTSMAILAAVEKKILSSLSSRPLCRYVPLHRSDNHIWTLSMNTDGSAKTPLVLLHGMGSGIALWVLNVDSLARDRPLYAIDVLGFGRSSRVSFSHDPAEAEMEFVQSIEDWRQAVGIDRMILLGHSLGGYLATSYALNHAERVKHLILVDPWGFPECPPQEEQRRDIPRWVRVIRCVISPFNPFSGLRLAGPWGPSLIARARQDLLENYSEHCDYQSVADYIYHCNAQKPSGEVAFKTLNEGFGWAKRPMMHRVGNVESSVTMTFVHGSHSWIDNRTGYEVKYMRDGSFVDVQVVRGAGHHIYADRPELFNNIVNRTCDMVDQPNAILRPLYLTPLKIRRMGPGVSDVLADLNKTPPTDTDDTQTSNS